MFSSLLSMNISFKAIVCIFDQKSFNNLVITLQEDDFMDEISMEYTFYQASKQEVPLSRSSSLWMNLPLLVYVYLFLSQEKKSMQEEILVSRHLLVWVQIVDCPFSKEQSCISSNSTSTPFNSFYNHFCVVEWCVSLFSTM